VGFGTIGGSSPSWVAVAFVVARDGIGAAQELGRPIRELVVASTDSVTEALREVPPPTLP
jgi:hypothetical protein